MEETLEGGRGPPRAVEPLEREREVQFCTADWAGVVWGVWGWGKNKIARTCCNCCDVGESAGKLCVLCGVGCLTGLSSSSEIIEHRIVFIKFSYLTNSEFLEGAP